jgi:hypothetical protein
MKAQDCRLQASSKEPLRHLFLYKNVVYRQVKRFIENGFFFLKFLTPTLIFNQKPQYLAIMRRKKHAH